MKKIVITAAAIIFCFWPQRQGHTQQMQLSQTQAHPDTLSLDKKIKAHILDNFSCLESEINRISHLHKKYVVRTHTKKFERYRIDTVMLFVDTCFAQTDTLYLSQDTMYMQKPKRKLFQKLKDIFHKRTPPRKDDLRVVPAWF